MSGVLSANNIIARGRYQIGAREVTAAELSDADGLLTLLVGDHGAFIMIEAGATLNGITVRNIIGDDLTNSDLDLATMLIVVASPASPYAVDLTHESLLIADPTDRLYLPSLSTPGTFADGMLTQHTSNFVWCPFVERWRISWIAP
jgi:hypothetical protein